MKRDANKSTSTPSSSSTSSGTSDPSYLRQELQCVRPPEAEVYRNVAFISRSDYVELSARCTPSSSPLVVAFPRRQPPDLKNRKLGDSSTPVTKTTAFNVAFFFSVFPDDRVSPSSIALSAQQRKTVDATLDAPVYAEFRTLSTIRCHPITALSLVLTPCPPRPGQPQQNGAINVKYDKLVQYLMSSFAGHIFNSGQSLPLLFEGQTLFASITKIAVSPIPATTIVKGKYSGAEPSGQIYAEDNEPIFGQLSASIPPTFDFTVPTTSASKLRVVTASTSRRDIPLNFRGMGVGGLDEQLEEIIKSAFLTRAMPTEFMEQYGITHSKGILLYGPPGTGKTLIARTIANMFGRKKVKSVAGPEIFSSLVGDSEKRIRELFEPAEKEYAEKGEESDLHIIIFDEIDAICKKRGLRSGDTGVGDAVVNQLLTKIDGVDSLNNILIIGMTNRIDMLDEALLRSGRLDVHLYNGLPDLKGRIAIFDIHTAKLRENSLLAEDVDLGYWAGRTTNFSGSDIKTLVMKAVQNALPRNFDTSDDKQLVVPKELTPESRTKITKADFEAAFARISPTHGKSANKLDPFLRRKYLAPFNESSKKISDISKRFVDTLLRSSECPTLSLLISGDDATGKTTLAAHLAVTTGAPFVSMIEAGELAGKMERDRIDMIDELFAKARQSDFSVLILDNVEGILAATPDGGSFSNSTLLKLQQLLKAPGNSKLYVIGTTSNPDFLQRVRLLSTFKRHEELGTVSTAQEVEDLVRHLVPPHVTVTSLSTKKEPSFRNIDQPVGSISMMLKMHLAALAVSSTLSGPGRSVVPLSDDGEPETAVVSPRSKEDGDSAEDAVPLTLDIDEFIDSL